MANRQQDEYLKGILAQEVQKLDVVRLQYRADIDAGHARVEALTSAIFNHGLDRTLAALDLPKPRIRSIHNRFDCFKRAKLAAEQIVEAERLILESGAAVRKASEWWLR